MSTLTPASDESSAEERPQLHRRVSVRELLSPAPTTGASPRETQDPKVDDEEPQAHNNVPSSNSNSSNDTTTSETAELRQEIECLEEVIDRLEDEKNALKMRLNEIEYFQKFQVGHCKRWLQANFDFDRKDSPDLLAGIFEDYLMQNDSLEPLPHQMIVKNSAKGRMRREKLVQQRTYRRGVKRDTKPATDAPPLKKPGNKTGDSTTSDNTTSNGIPSTSNNNNVNNNNPWSIYNVFIPVEEMERLFALEPWRSIPQNWPKVMTAAKTGAVQELLATQDAFLEENARAIWERTHWFPIKQQNGRTEAETRRLAQLHNRRKKRQMVLKNGLEEISRRLHKTPGVDRAVLRQSVFSAEAVETLLKRPRLWIPREGEDLVAQLEQLDREDPDRQKYV